MKNVVIMKTNAKKDRWYLLQLLN